MLQIPALDIGSILMDNCCLTINMIFDKVFGEMFDGFIMLEVDYMVIKNSLKKYILKYNVTAAFHQKIIGHMVMIVLVCRTVVLTY